MRFFCYIRMSRLKNFELQTVSLYTSEAAVHRHIPHIIHVSIEESVKTSTTSTNLK